ncbi:MULE domain-containing protein [Trichonephila clavipes]|nr:MULE domain-containing protein [Trichonephila clavipes]
MWTPELAPPSPNYHTTPHQREDGRALDRFNVYRSPTRRVFSRNGFELVTKPATIPYLDRSATAASFRTPGYPTLVDKDDSQKYQWGSWERATQFTKNSNQRERENLSFKYLRTDIREEITVDSGRKMLIEKKDIHNIKRDFNIKGYVKRHEIDAVSVKLWAEEMKNNGENCIVFFKEQGQSRNDYCVKDEDFVLVILTDFQKKMIKKYGKDKICIDGTHGLNTAMITIYTQFL